MDSDGITSTELALIFILLGLFAAMFSLGLEWERLMHFMQ
jgi:hypothetical protein